MLTQEYLNDKFDLLENGMLILKSTGRICGTVKAKYIYITIDHVEYLMHRVIWLWYYGYLPERIDHGDNNGYNNRIGNLREATPSQNAANADYGPMRGVEKHGAKYRVRIWVNSMRIELGSYTSLEEAKEAFRLGSIEHYGEFAQASRIQ